MNKLHNFRFVGEFPMFVEQSEDDGNASFINAPRKYSHLPQDIYLPPPNHQKGYLDPNDNDILDTIAVNLRFVEGFEPLENGFGNGLENAEIIFLNNVKQKAEKQVGGVQLMDIYLGAPPTTPSVVGPLDMSDPLDGTLGEFAKKSIRKTKAQAKGSKKKKFSQQLPLPPLPLPPLPPPPAHDMEMIVNSPMFYVAKK